MDTTSGLLTIATVHFLGVISPGQNFAIVVKNSLLKSRKETLFTVIGISAGMLIHISCCIFGLSVLIHTSPQFLIFIKNIGGIYLLYLAVQFIIAAKSTSNLRQAPSIQKSANLHAFLEGFLCHLSNVSSFLFILSLFSTVIQQHTPLSIKILYGIIMIIISLLWFSSLTFLISIHKFKQIFFKLQKQINIIFGITLGSIGLFILTTQ